MELKMKALGLIPKTKKKKERRNERKKEGERREEGRRGGKKSEGEERRREVEKLAVSQKINCPLQPSCSWMWNQEK